MSAFPVAKLTKKDESILFIVGDTNSTKKSTDDKAMSSLIYFDAKRADSAIYIDNIEWNKTINKYHYMDFVDETLVTKRGEDPIYCDFRRLPYFKAIRDMCDSVSLETYISSFNPRKIVPDNLTPIRNSDLAQFLENYLDALGSWGNINKFMRCIKHTKQFEIGDQFYDGQYAIKWEFSDCVYTKKFHKSVKTLNPGRPFHMIISGLICELKCSKTVYFSQFLGARPKNTRQYYDLVKYIYSVVTDIYFYGLLAESLFSPKNVVIHCHRETASRLINILDDWVMAAICQYKFQLMN